MTSENCSGNAYSALGVQRFISLILIGLLIGNSIVFGAPLTSNPENKHLSPISSLWDKHSPQVTKWAEKAGNLLVILIPIAFVYEVLVPFFSLFWPQKIPSLIPIPFIFAVYSKIMILNAIATFWVIEKCFGDYQRDDIVSAMDSAMASDSDFPVYDYWGKDYRYKQWFMFFVSLFVSSLVAHLSLGSGQVPSNAAYQRLVREYHTEHSPVSPPSMESEPKPLLPTTSGVNRSV